MARYLNNYYHYRHDSPAHRLPLMHPSFCMLFLQSSKVVFEYVEHTESTEPVELNRLSAAAKP